MEMEEGKETIGSKMEGKEDRKDDRKIENGE